MVNTFFADAAITALGHAPTALDQGRPVFRCDLLTSVTAGA